MEDSKENNIYREIYANLETFPEAVLAEDSPIDTVSLFGNRLSTFPPESALISLSTRLTTLDLCRNVFTVFPKPLLSCRLLETLDISENMLTSLPDEINQLENLISLRVSRNEIRGTLPLSLGELPKLRYLRADCNLLTEAPILRNPNLEDLDLSENLISGTIRSHCFQDLPQLKALVLSQNKISSFEVNLELLKNLVRLDLSYNDLSPSDSLFLSPCIGIIQNIDVSGNTFLMAELPPLPPRNIPVRVDEFERPSQITENLFLGSWMSTRNRHYLKSVGITHIFCVAKRLKYYHENEFERRLLEIDDEEGEDIQKHFIESNKYLHQILDDKTKTNKVLVHCAMGISRSATIVIAYLIWARQYSYPQAFNYVAERRPIICPNNGFRDQLITFSEEVCHPNRMQCPIVLLWIFRLFGR